MSLLKKIGHALKSVAKIAAPIVGTALGSPFLGAAVSSALSSKGAKKASGAQVDANTQAIAQQRDSLQQANVLQQPYRDLGTSGINDLMKVNSGDYTGFNSSPDYLYARDEALKGVQGGAAARGGLYSGAAGRELERVAGGLASENLGTYRNSLFQTIGVGQNATNATTNATLNTGNNISNALMNQGDARASGIVGSTNAITGGIDQIAGALGDYYGTPVKKKPVAGANSLYGVNFRQRPVINTAVG